MNHCINHPDRPVKTRGLCVACEGAARRRGILQTFPTIRAAASVVLCPDCGEPVSRGRTSEARNRFVRCLPCEVAQSLAGWSYPVARRLRRKGVSL